MHAKLGYPLALLFAAAAVGAAAAAILTNLVTFRAPRALQTMAPPSRAGTLEGAIVFDPPRPEDAPPDLREPVMYGYAIFTDTARRLPDHVGNPLSCANCHFDGGRSKEGISLVGVAAVYPKYRARTRYATDLVSRTNECFQRSMNGKPLDPESHEMQALVAYYQWISRGLPIYGDIPWLGLRRVDARHTPDPEAGKAAWAENCAVCHGGDGAGSELGPPVWGDASFNDGAGMHRVETLAAFARWNMPRTAPDLTDEQALDVAAFVAKQPRPHFAGARKL
jgi:thiosulfate dehydrogenase